MYVREYMHVSACICMCMYKYVCIHVEVRGQPWVLFLGNLPICFLRQSFTETWILLIRLTGQEAKGIFLPLLPQHWVYKHVYSIQLFPSLCALRIKVGSPFLYGKWSIT